MKHRQLKKLEHLRQRVMEVAGKVDQQFNIPGVTPDTEAELEAMDCFYWSYQQAREALNHCWTNEQTARACYQLIKHPFPVERIPF